VVSALIAGVLLVAAFIVWERRAEHPMVPPAMFRSRTFAAANGVSFFMYAGLFGALFLMSQLLQNALGYSPLQAGLRLLPWSFPPMIIAPIAGALAERYGNRPFMVLGLAMQAAGLAWVASIVSPGMAYAQLGVALTVAGIGTSFCFPTVANAIMGSMPVEEAGVASGVNSAIRELGGVFGVAVLASVFVHNGSYGGAHAFIHGFAPAVWVAVALSALGIVAGLLTGGRRLIGRQGEAVAVAEPAVA
jgi:MFS family permease